MLFTFYSGLPQVALKLLRIWQPLVESGGCWLVILPWITRLWTRNPKEEWLIPLGIILAHGRGILWKNRNSAGNYQLMDEESSGRIEIPPGITSSWTRNPPKEWLFHWEILAYERWFRQDQNARQSFERKQFQDN
jgi:hypothetical protein